MKAAIHLPVMLDEVLEELAVQEDGYYIDCTFGRGGHSQAILEKLGPSGKLLALDKDKAAVVSKNAQRLMKDPRFEIVQQSFACLEELAKRRGWLGQVAGILMDLGVSSPQLDEAERGFSFLHEGPLDMRMNAQSGMSAAEWIARVEETELADVLKRYGEERFARRIARAIVERRAVEPIKTTRQLAEIIECAVPVREKTKHPATRSFQAIRLFINRELEELRQGLIQAVPVLRPGGRLVAIAFHSLEDRIVKRFIRDEARGGSFPAGMPIEASAYSPRLKKIGKAQRPSAEEVSRNPRARSAVLRAAERL